MREIRRASVGGELELDELELDELELDELELEEDRDDDDDVDDELDELDELELDELELDELLEDDEMPVAPWPSGSRFAVRLIHGPTAPPCVTHTSPAALPSHQSSSGELGATAIAVVSAV